MKLNFNAWHRCETKMVQFRLNNSPGKYSSTSPCLVLIIGKGDFYSSTDILFWERLSLTIYVNERFKPPSSSQAAIRSTFASLIGRMSQTAHSGDLATACLHFRGFGFLFKLVISLLC